MRHPQSVGAGGQRECALCFEVEQRLLNLFGGLIELLRQSVERWRTAMIDEMAVDGESDRLIEIGYGWCCHCEPVVMENRNPAAFARRAPVMRISKKLYLDGAEVVVRFALRSSTMRSKSACSR